MTRLQLAAIAFVTGLACYTFAIIAIAALQPWADVCFDRYEPMPAVMLAPRPTAAPSD